MAEQGAATALVVSGWAVKPGTLRRYQSVFCKWTTWCEQNSLGIGLQRVEQPLRGLVFVNYLGQLKGSGGSLAHVSASLRHFLSAAGHSTDFLDETVVSRVRLGYNKNLTHDGKDAADEEIYEAMWDIVNEESGILFGRRSHQSPFTVHMTAVAASLEFHWGFRVSQVAKSGDANHFLVHGDVYFVLDDNSLLDTHAAVTSWSESPVEFIQHLAKVNFGVASTKTTDKCRAFELVNGTSTEESFLIDQFLVFLSYSSEWLDAGRKFSPQSPVFEVFYLGGSSRKVVKRLMLDQSLASSLIKTAAARVGRDPSKFATHSWRRGGVTTLRSDGLSAEETMRISMHRDRRSLDIYDESTVKTGALGAKESTKIAVVTNNRLRSLRRVSRALEGFA